MSLRYWTCLWNAVSAQMGKNQVPVAVYSQGFVLIITIMYIQVLGSVANHINEIYYLLPALPVFLISSSSIRFEHENV